MNFENLNQVNALPAWNLSAEYKSLDSDDFKNDFEVLSKNISLISLTLSEIEKIQILNPIQKIISVLNLFESTYEILLNLFSYLKCELNINYRNEQALKLNNQFSKLLAEYNNQGVEIENFFANASNEIIDEILKDEKAKSWAFFVKEVLRKKEITLSINEEKIINTLNVNGINAWSKFYDKAINEIKVDLKNENGQHEKISLNKAKSYLNNSDNEIRKDAYNAIKDSFNQNEHIFSSCLNAIAGTKIDIAKLRSRNREVHFLENSLTENTLSKSTIDAIFEALDNNNPGRKAAKNIATFLNKDKLDPWDFNFTSTNFLETQSDYMPYDTAIELITNAFGEVDQCMADFVSEMTAQNNIEARILETKKAGGNCSYFPKSQNSKVYMSYNGSIDNAIILSHELGHAYQNYVTRKISRANIASSMALAETTSTFCEILFLDYLQKKYINDEALLKKLNYTTSQNVMLYLLDIPTRFEFEYEFYEKRKSTQLMPSEITALIEKHSQKRYGDTINAADSFSWASKRHYYMTKTFYNYPYIFGYLFSHGLFALKNEMKNEFHKKFTSMICDFGKMPAEELTLKHFNIDIATKDFWAKSLNIIDKKM